MDKMDKGILDYLRDEPRTTNTALAFKMNVSRQTVIRRLNKLVACGALSRTVEKLDGGGYFNVWTVK
jgi:DNA-binding Lrp family transcriptional regulator